MNFADPTLETTHILTRCLFNFAHSAANLVKKIEISSATPPSTLSSRHPGRDVGLRVGRDTRSLVPDVYRRKTMEDNVAIL